MCLQHINSYWLPVTKSPWIFSELPFRDSSARCIKKVERVENPIHWRSYADGIAILSEAHVSEANSWMLRRWTDTGWPTSNDELEDADLRDSVASTSCTYQQA